MLKKITLLSLLLCMTTTQTDFSEWETGTGSKLALATFCFTATSAGSYAMYKIYCLAIDRLEQDKKISLYTAARLKNILGARGFLLPLYVIYAYYSRGQTMPKSYLDIFKKFLYNFSYGSQLIGPEMLIWEKAVKLFLGRK